MDPEPPTEDIKELRRAILYLADALLQLTRTVDLMAMHLRNRDPKFLEFAEAAWSARGRIGAAVDLLVKSDESSGAK
jgi:hypothetical protein